ncbi:MAG: hypothetical protein KGJ62_06655 [Armatimonadetes bacterium]|nr:hypothetical protein [Armatimonadota bacterium]MDE2207578.1 hypothetical protein [Armatimonadota bacterium]
MSSSLAAVWTLLALVHTGPTSARSQALSPARDRAAGVIHNLKLKVGLPLGGIGAGAVRILSDGEFSRGGDSTPLPGCFAAVRAGSGACVLALHNGCGLPCAPRIDFKGLFPTATVTPSGAGLPLDVSWEAFSPFVPGDLRDSSEPGAIVVITLRNPSQHAVPAAALLSWQGMPAPGGTAGTPVVSTVPVRDNLYGLRISSGTPRFGETTLASAAVGPDSVVTRTGWRPGAGPPSWWAAFAQTGRLPQDQEIGSSGAIAVSTSVAPGATVRIPFAVTWFASDATSTLGGRYYGNWASSSTDIARNLLQDWRSLRVLTDEWHFALMTSDLPPWLIRAEINSLAGMVTQTSLMRGGEFAWRPATSAYGASPAGVMARSITLVTLFPQLEAFRLATDAANLAGVGSTRIALLALRLALYQRCTGDRTLAQLTARPLAEAALTAAGPTDTAGCGIQITGWRALARLLAQSGETSMAQSLLNRTAHLMVQYAAGLKSQSPSSMSAGLLGVWAARLLVLPPPAPSTLIAQAQASGAAGSAPGRDMADSVICRGDLAIRTGSVTSGLEVLDAIDTSAWESEGGPFDVQEVGLFWPVLAALEGAGIRLSTGELDLIPSIPGSWRELNAPIFLPTLTGWMRFRPYAHGESFSLRVDRLVAPPTLGPAQRLVLARLRIPAPVAIKAAQEEEVHVLLNGNPAPANASRVAGGVMQIRFTPSLKLNAGDTVRVSIH